MATSSRLRNKVVWRSERRPTHVLEFAQQSFWWATVSFKQTTVWHHTWSYGDVVSLISHILGVSACVMCLNIQTEKQDNLLLAVSRSRRLSSFADRFLFLRLLKQVCKHKSRRGLVLRVLAFWSLPLSPSTLIHSFNLVCLSACLLQGCVLV